MVTDLERKYVDLVFCSPTTPERMEEIFNTPLVEKSEELSPLELVNYFLEICKAKDLENDQRFINLGKVASRAKSSLDSGNLLEIAKCFATLGITAGSLFNLTPWEVQRYRQLKNIASRTEINIARKTHEVSQIHDTVSWYANHFWQLDHDKEILTGKMCEKVWVALQDADYLCLNLKKHKYTKHESIRKIVSTVAKNYPWASKRGQPKKK